MNVLWLGFALCAAQEWQTARVPGAWETQGPAEARGYDGFAWFRAWIKPHDNFFTPHERHLFEESVVVGVRDVADAYECFVNGKPVGGSGRMPPEFERASAGLRTHKVPRGTLKPGLWNEIAVRVYNRAGPGGFLGDPPFIMGYFMECVLEGPWEFRLGDDPSWAGAARATQPARAAFDRYAESSRVLGEAAERVPGPALPPAEALAALRPDPSLRVEQLLTEPRVAQPVHFSFDARGRLWLAQYRQYPYPAGLRMISRDKYFRSHYDRMPPPPPNHDRGRDVISIHEDTDGDGAFDRHKVFVDELNMANAVLVGRGGVWVMHTPYLLFYPDANADDVPDGPPVVCLAGFGLEDTHSVANGLVWGLDGWIYGAQGSTTSSRVTRPGLDPPGAPGVAFEGCMVWRYHPETRVYEIFAEGGGNNFGLEVDAEGRLYTGHNGGQTRGWHFVQGGIYLKQGVDPGKFGPPRNPYVFGELPMIKSRNEIPRFSHFFAVASGTALPTALQGKLLSVDPLHNVVIASARRPLGSTFETEDVGPVLSSADTSFRPVFIANAPDGSILVADLYEHYIAHGQHYQNQIDPSTGRLYRLRGDGLALESDVRLDRKTTAQLVELLSHANPWHRHAAARLLGERRDPAAVDLLRRRFAGADGPAALGALWALFQMGALDEATARAGLRHAYAPARAWAVRLLGERDRISPETAAELVARAGQEPDAEVRAQIASTARRLPASQAMPLAAALLARDEDAADPYVPPLLWFVVEQRVGESIAALFADKSLWDRALVRDYILPRLMRRLAAEGRRADLLVCARLLREAPAAAPLIKGIEEAYRGRAMTGLPDELLAALAERGGSSLALRVRQGQPEARAEALALLRDPKGKVEERLLYARLFGELPHPTAAAVLLELAERDAVAALRRAALASLAAYDDPAIGARLTAGLSGMPADVQSAALATLTARAGWTRELLNALESGAVAVSIVPPETADRLRLSGDARSAKLFPPPGAERAARIRARIAEVEAILRGGAGDPYAGEPIYMQRCAKCHRLFFKGGNVGPDLTSYQRDARGALLVNIIDPNAEVREGFEYAMVETADGRNLAGLIVDRDVQVTVVRGLDGQETTLRAAEITAVRPAGLSLMPEGLLDGLKDQELRDLFAYLRISQPITR